MSNQLIKIEEVTTIMSTFPDIVGRNRNSVAKCKEAGQAILDTIEGQGMTEELDQKAAEYLKKVGVTVKNMNDRRAPITQIFDRIRSFFTSQEKAIDLKDPNTIPGRIIKQRNEYAEKKYQAEQLRKKEAEKLSRFNGEKATYKASIEKALLAHFNNYLLAKKTELNNMFNGMSLESFNRDANMIRLFSTEYPQVHFNSFIDNIPTYYLDTDTKRTIRNEVLEGKYEHFKGLFYQEIKNAIQYCADRFFSKQTELTEIENLKKVNAEAAEKAEAERIEREKQDELRRSEAEKQKVEQQQREIDAAAQTEQMKSLFDQSAATVSPAPVNAKVKEKIKVLHPAGFLEVFNLWWINEGQALPITELEKIFKKQITYCEKQANSKEPKHIQSQYIQYQDDVKAK